MKTFARMPGGKALIALAMVVLVIGTLPSIEALAFGTQPITGQVARGKMAVLRRFFLYEPSACHGVAPPPWRVDPKPQFGTVAEFSGSMKLPNGPCPNVEMPYLELRYTAGNQAGQDKFTLFVSDGDEFTRIAVILTVR